MKNVSFFGLLLIFSFVLFTYIVWKKAKEKLYAEETVFDAVFFVSFFFFAGARAAFILLNFSRFGVNPFKWVLFTGYPGFEFYGGLVGALFALRYFFVRKVKKMAFWEMLDYFSEAFFPAYILSQIGVFFSGGEVGKAVNGPLPRHPVSLYRALILLLFFILLLKYKKELFFRQGNFVLGLFGLSLLFIFSLVNFLVDNLAEGEVYYLNLTVGQWVNLVLIIVYLYFIYRKIGYNLKLKLGKIKMKKNV